MPLLFRVMKKNISPYFFHDPLFFFMTPRYRVMKKNIRSGPGLAQVWSMSGLGLARVWPGSGPELALVWPG